jgi:HPt (histidine-containing phosphotransfer) domain-containing protein
VAWVESDNQPNLNNMELQTTTLRYDLSYLNQVFQGNREMINNIIKLFLQQVPDYITEMEECVRKNEPLSLHPLAHKAKSSVSMLGIKDMETDILQIEQDSKHLRNLDALPALVARLKVNCSVVYTQLMEALERPSMAA